jgi:hypothetical protein
MVKKCRYLVLGPLCRYDAFILGVGLHQAAVRRTTNLLNMENNNTYKTFPNTVGKVRCGFGIQYS